MKQSHGEPNRLLAELRAHFDSNVFVMMRYRPGPQHQKIEEAIRSALSEFGLVARLAKDRALSDDLWRNIQLYMQNSKYGIVVFEEINEREFNPNVSMELGYMYALGRRCLVLKDSRMPALPTDICGKIYRNFDTYGLPGAVAAEVRNWCERDLGLVPKSQESADDDREGVVIYDSGTDPNFESWSLFATGGWRHNPISLAKDEALGEAVMRLEARDREFVGINRSLRTLHGRVFFSYRVSHAPAYDNNMLFFMVPMQETGPGRYGLIEVGTDVQDDPRNAYSPHRTRYIVPESHAQDGQWHAAALEFDFRSIHSAFYSIFAPRINEGVPNGSAGILLVARVSVEVWQDGLELTLA